MVLPLGHHVLPSFTGGRAAAYHLLHPGICWTDLLRKTIEIASIRALNCALHESEGLIVGHWQSAASRIVDTWTAEFLASRTASLTRLEGAFESFRRLETEKDASLRQAIAEVERNQASSSG